MAITRFKNSSIVNNGPKYNDFQAGIPFRPVIGTATNVGTSRPYNNGAATVSFTANNTDSSVTYTATSSPGSFTGSGNSSPVTVSGLQSATAYTFTVVGSNSNGTSLVTAASNSITATTVPQAPTIGTATAGNANASVTFTANATGGSAITSYTATSSPGNITGTGSASPITVSGLTNGTAYTFSVTATNANGTSAASAASNSVTPSVPSNFVSLATFTGGSNTATFSSIPSTYKHLQIRAVAKSTTGTNAGYAFRFWFNNDLSGNYFWQGTFGNNTNTFTQNTGNGDVYISSPGQQVSRAGVLNVGHSCFIIDIYNYNTSNNRKMATQWGGFCQPGAGASNFGMQTGVWNSSAVIDRVDVQLSTGNWDSNTSIALYGIG